MIVRSAAALLLALAAILSHAGAVHAQGDSGSIMGYVFDQSGAPIKGVKVTASSPTQIGGSKSTYSNDEGMFRFAQLSPGTFTVSASAPNLDTAIQKGVLVGISAPAEVSIVMQVATSEERVTVVQKAPIISTTKANIKDTFDLDFVEMLPHENRDNVHSQMVNAIPGAMNGRVRGGAANQTKFTQDGFDMRTDLRGGQYPTLKSSAAYEIQSGGYGADDPTASGGLINLVTKSGSNKFEFELNATADSTRLRFFTDARDQVSTYNQYIISPTISGPIVRDLLWFHFNMESHLEDRVREIPADAVYLPEPTKWVKRIHKGTLKLTWQVSTRNKLSSVSNFDIIAENNRRDDAGVDLSAQEHRRTRRLFSGLIWESLLTDNLVLRSQIGASYVPQHVYPANCVEDADNCDDVAAIQQKYPRNIWYGNNNNHERDDLWTAQFNNRMNWFVSSKTFGDHDVTLKNNFYTESDVRRLSRPGNVFLEYNGGPEALTRYFSNDPRVDEARQGWFITEVSTRRNTSTLSDSWRPSRHLTLTPAVSYIWTQASNSRGDQIVGNATWAPSITGAWDATGDGRTALRGGFSTYVDIDTAELARHTLGSQVSQRCRWDEATQGYTRDCQYSGGGTKNTFGLPCGPTGVRVDGTSCDEELNIPRTWEWTLGGQREIVQGIALSLDGVYRKFTNQYERNETNRIWRDSGESLESSWLGAYRNGKNEQIQDLGTPADGRRRYLGVTAGIDKREGQLRLKASYTWSRLDGNVFDGSSNPYGDIPGRDLYLDGPLGDDHRHEIKLQLAYQLARWISLGSRTEYMSGLPYSRRFRNDETGGFENYRARIGHDPGANINDPGDDRPLRRPDRLRVNGQLRINWAPLIGHQLDTYVDVLNLLALRTPTSLGQDDGRNFGLEQNRQEPFKVRLGLNYRY